MSLSAAIFSVLLLPKISNMPIEAQYAISMASAVGYYTVYSISYQIIARFVYRKILGTWYYATKPHEDSPHKDPNVAVMKFLLSDGGNMKYRVETFENIELLSNRKISSRKGIAVSRALEYDFNNKQIFIVFYYNILKEVGSNTSREGQLTLNLLDDGTMEGFWSSEVKVSQESKSIRSLSAGGMKVFPRFEQLKKYLESERKS